MIHLVTGGSGSGKSVYAEDWLKHSVKEKVPLLYIATMIPYGEEAEKKVKRHQRLRKGKGFRTLECYRNLAEQKIPENAGILLECVSNLAANEYFDASGSLRDHEGTKLRILEGIRHLSSQTEYLVIVTNEVNSDINNYTKETEKYRRLIGEVNQSLGAMADRVTEVVYGIPMVIKDEK